jgi:hypothetical protein
MLRRGKPARPPPAGGGPITRRRRLEQLEPLQADHISTLPDDLLGEIISLLPVKDGGRTQVLASRWRHLWRSAPLNLDGIVSPLNVPRILDAHLGPIRRFRVRTLSSCAEVGAWFRSAALDGLQELDFARYMMQRVPASIFHSSNTLRTVTLASCKLLDPAMFQGLHFPLLKILGLERVIIRDLSLQRLVDGCTALEFLLVHTNPRFRRLRINSLTLASICVHIDDPNRSAEPHLEELIIESVPRLQRVIHRYSTFNLDVSVFSSPEVETSGILADWHNFYTGLVSFSGVIRVIDSGFYTSYLHRAYNQPSFYV